MIRKMHPYIRMVKFNDDSFMSLSESEIKRFAHLQQNANIPFVATGCNPSLVTEQKIALMVKAGLRRTRIGIQTGNQRVLKDIYNRKVPKEDIIRSSRILSKYSKQMVPVSYDIILDNPWEKTEETVDTFNLISELKRPFLLNLYSLTPYPKTALYNFALKDGMVDVGKIGEGKVKNFCDLNNNYLNCLITLLGIIPIPNYLKKLLLNKRFINRNPQIPKIILSMLTTLIEIKRVYYHISKRDVTMLPFFLARML